MKKYSILFFAAVLAVSLSGAGCSNSLESTISISLPAMRNAGGASCDYLIAFVGESVGSIRETGSCTLPGTVEISNLPSGEKGSIFVKCNQKLTGIETAADVVIEYYAFSDDFIVKTGISEKTLQAKYSSDLNANVTVGVEIQSFNTPNLTAQVSEGIYKVSFDYNVNGQTTHEVAYIQIPTPSASDNTARISFYYDSVTVSNMEFISVEDGTVYTTNPASIYLTNDGTIDIDQTVTLVRR
ncbi:MAG: hypothetical protein J6N81_07730 [Treponema sp.]|nr:hypothetical protein [Treponema sp.]MBP3280731.1 hypothetical protein [Treponema sp.]